MATKKMIDPPSGWKYGFPKEIPESVLISSEDLKSWLLDQGYPQNLIPLALQYSRFFDEENLDKIQVVPKFKVGEIYKHTLLGLVEITEYDPTSNNGKFLSLRRNRVIGFRPEDNFYPATHQDFIDFTNDQMSWFHKDALNVCIDNNGVYISNNIDENVSLSKKEVKHLLKILKANLNIEV